MRRWWVWMVALLPAAAGTIIAVLIATELLPNHEIYLAGRLIFVAPLFGLLISAAMLAILVIITQTRSNQQRRLTQIQTQAAEERRRFLRRLDHELKNPLTAIRAGLANLAWLSGASERQEALTSVEAQVLRLSRLAADLRKLAELETRPLERTPVNLVDLLQEVVDIAHERPEAEQRRITLTIPQAPWPLPEVEGDYDLLFLAVHNLVDNALKFTQQGDTLEVRAFEDGTAVVIEVADTGPGVPEEDMAHIWDELYRGRGARGIPGSGLGLALVRAIAERHNGRVSLRSRAGQGTVFTLRLPI